MKTLESWYTEQIQNKTLIFDQLQLNTILLFDNFIPQIKTNIIAQLFNRPTHLGFYVYGSVGRGKSMLINEFFTHIPINKKLRIHFHEFMHEIHQKLSTFTHELEPLNKIAKDLKKLYTVIFLDEMHVSDIATAMILKNLFTALFKENIYIITSSNYAPHDLYPNGLMRERFLPAITLIEEKLKVVSLDGPRDYRLSNTSDNKLFLIKSHNTQQYLNRIFDKVRQNNTVDTNGLILIAHREIHYTKKSKNIIWFDFNVICGDMRSQLDYLELSQEFNWFIIENVYELPTDKKDIARRFTWLVDILYDENKKLAMSCTCDLNKIYPHGDFSNEFGRTISRLTEMQTDEYLKKLPINRIIET